MEQSKYPSKEITLLQVKIPKREIMELDQAASFSSMSRSAFVRFNSLREARKIIRENKEVSSSNE